MSDEASKIYEAKVRDKSISNGWLLLDTATRAVSSQEIQHDLGAKSTNWLAGWLAD